MSRRYEFSEEIKKQLRKSKPNPARHEKRDPGKWKLKSPWILPKAVVDLTSDGEDEQVLHRYDLRANGSIQDESSGGEQDKAIKSLRKIIHKQAQMIQKLDRDVLEMRKNASQQCTCQKDAKLETDDMLAYINCKIDLLTEQALFIAEKVSLDRRCRGYCIKHVRTKKCLCRGFQDAHRCCGQVGSICDC